MKLHCVHVSIGRKKPWDPVKMDALKEYLKEEYPEQKIKCSIMVSDNIFNGLETYIRNNNISIVSFNMHKRNLFMQLFSPSITRKALSRFNKPCLCVPLRITAQSGTTLSGKRRPQYG
jgi:hypothetical protein